MLCFDNEININVQINDVYKRGRENLAVSSALA